MHTDIKRMSYNLGGVRALVTGGTSGIGRAVSCLMASAGAKVAINFLPDDLKGREFVVGLMKSGHDVVEAPGDVSSPTSGPAMVADAIERLGGLDILVNNAGTAGSKTPIQFSDLHAMTDEFWSTIMSTNLLGPFRCVKAAEQALRQSGGAIVNTASVAGLGTRGSSIAYAASKAALINMTQNLARALAPTIRVNAVAPGLIDSPWTTAWSAERKDATVKQSLLNRMGRPEEVAEAILFMAVGPGYINGQTIVINGGQG